MSLPRLPARVRAILPTVVRLVLVLLVLPAAAVTRGTQPAGAETAGRSVNIVLEDQFRNRRGTDQLRGDVVVLVYADRHGAEKALELGRRLHLRFHPTADGAAAEEWSRQPVVGLPGWPAGVRVPDVHVVPIACVPEVPKALHAVARTRLRKESPHVSVWLDFDDALRQHFGAVPAEPNVAIVDTAGSPRGTTAGQLDDLRFEELVRAVDQLRLQARPDVRTATLPGAVVPVSGLR